MRIDEIVGEVLARLPEIPGGTVAGPVCSAVGDLHRQPGSDPSGRQAGRMYHPPRVVATPRGEPTDGETTTIVMPDEQRIGTSGIAPLMAAAQGRTND